MEVKNGLFSSEKFYIYFNGLSFWKLDLKVMRGGLAEARQLVATNPKGQENFTVLTAAPKHDDGSKLVVLVFL